MGSYAAAFRGRPIYGSSVTTPPSRRSGAHGRRCSPSAPSSSTSIGRLLYEGPWLAERLAGIKAFYESSPEALHTVVREVLAGGLRFTATDVFEAQHRLEALKTRCSDVWKHIDVLVVPTAGTIYRVEEVAHDPIRLNSNLGYYTNFVNLLDLAALAIPAGFRDDGLPFGITFIAPPLEDGRLAHWGARFHERSGSGIGATRFLLPPMRGGSERAGIN
jgi:allophanate hydrolase